MCCVDVAKAQSLADLLDVEDPRPEDARADLPLEDETVAALDISDPKEFCKKILESREFRRYIMHGIVLGDIPPAVLSRVMDQGWGKVTEKLEHTGKDGKPIEVTEIRRVLVRAKHERIDRHDVSSHNESASKVTH